MAGSSKIARREHAIESARRRLRRLEIEAHRIKAELARLEADYEEDVADDLLRKFRRDHGPNGARNPAVPRETAATVSADARKSEPRSVPSILPTIEVAPTAPVRSSRPLVRKASNRVAAPDKSSPARVDARPANAPAVAPPRIVSAGVERDGSPQAERAKRGSSYRQSAPALLVSAGLHAVVLALCVTLTFATLVQQSIPLFASPPALDEMPERLGEIEITAHKFADDEVQTIAASDAAFNVSDALVREFDPAVIGAGAESTGDMGQLDADVGDLGTLMAGTGQPGSGPMGGPPGAAVFFGAQSQGNRFVYVIDNSSSMKGGRLEFARAELVKSIEALTPRQAFYVIFVSDQPYPMFYPMPERDLVPATPANKKRLADWLPKAILASGKNRELIKAMDLAALLRPHAVFLLWDGDMKYSDKVRTDVMTHLTRPNQWNFAIHTLGMGVTSLDAEYNLTAIAQAHRGTYRKVPVPQAAR